MWTSTIDSIIYDVIFSLFLPPGDEMLQSLRSIDGCAPMRGRLDGTAYVCGTKVCKHIHHPFSDSIDLARPRDIFLNYEGVIII